MIEENMISYPGLYSVYSPSGRQYIGITTTSFRQRYVEHLSHVKINTLIGKAFRKHGKMMLMTPLVVCENQEALVLMEKNAIRVFDTLVPNGYNLSSGGETGHIICEEMKCDYCENIFQGRIGVSKFCSTRCQKSSRYFSGVENEIRNCERCEKEFSVNRHRKVRFCSRSCGSIGHHRQGTSVIIDDMIYPSLRTAGQALGTDHHTIKRRYGAKDS